MISPGSHLKFGQALYRAAHQLKAEEQVLSDLEAVSQLFRAGELAKQLQQLSYLPAEVSRKVLTATFGGKVHELVLNLIVLLAYGKALKLTPKITAVFRSAYYNAKGIIEMTVRTARKFTPQEEQNFIQQLQAKKHHPVSVKFEHDPALIAGVQVYEKSYLTDYSVKNYLETLQKHLLSQQLI